MTLLTDHLGIRLPRIRLGAEKPGATVPAAPVDAIRALPDQDRRLALFRGIANWFVFLGHVPNNVASLLTLRDLGFSGAADVFVFILGYWSAATYGKMMLERGFVVAATRIFGRVWHLYATYIVVFVMYIAVIGTVAAQYAAPDILNEFNIAAIVDHPIRTLMSGLLLQAKPLNLDLLQLLVALQALLLPALWLMLRRPDLAIIGSFALYLAARWFDWNLQAFPDGNWPFNPYCWQFAFLFGAWFALVGAEKTRWLRQSPILLGAAMAYVLFALVITLAGHVAAIAALCPGWLLDAFLPNDKTNLEPYRVLHFMALAILANRFMPRDWRGLQWRILQPVILCGEHALPVFCVGVFLSFLGRVVLTTMSGSLAMQILVSVTGLAMMACVAYYVSWSKRQ
jgi:hypothetical protein